MRSVKSVRTGRSRRRPGDHERNFPARRKWVWWLRLCSVFYVVALLIAWAMLHFGGDVWWLPTVMLFGPRWVAAVPLALLVPVALLADRRTLLLLGVAAALVLGPVMGWKQAFGRHASNAAADVRLLTYNIGGETADAKPALEDLRRLVSIAKPDIAALQECDISSDELTAMFPGYHVNKDGENCLLSHFAITKSDPRDREDLHAIGGAGFIDRYEFVTSRGPISLVNLQLATVRKGLQGVIDRSADALAGMRYSIAERRAESRLAREWAARSQVPQLIAGDFNIPVDSAIFRAYWTDFADAHSSCGSGFGYTKYTKWFGIRIDHVLFDSHWYCTDASVDDSMKQGDHRPLIVDLRLK